MTKDTIESAYCFFHQKWNVYARSTMEWQKDDIEYAIGSYADDMNPELYALLSHGNASFLRDHTTFAYDLTAALEQLEQMMEECN